MSQRDQLLVLASVILSDDQDWMPMGLLLLHEFAHVLWHVAFCHEEFTSLEVNCLFGCDVPHRLSTERLVFLTFLNSCNVMVNSPFVLDGFLSALSSFTFFCLTFEIAHDSQVLSAPLVIRMLSAAAVSRVFASLKCPKIA